MQIKKILNIIIALGLVMAVGLGTGLPSARAALQAVAPNNHITANAQDTGYPDWYQDFGNLKLTLCLNDLPGTLCLPDDAAPDPVLGVAGESFWWSAETLMPAPTNALIVLAMEAAFTGENPVAGQQISFGRVRIRVDVPVAGTYTVIHPFGVDVYNVATPGLRAINDTRDIGALAAPANFSLALNSEIGPFLFWDADFPQADANGRLYICNPAVGHKVLGSPFGTNFFRIEGPPGADLGGPPGQENIIETDLFTVSGRVFLGDGNTAPLANPDAGATNMDAPVLLDLLGNDAAVDIPINPTSFAITNGVGGTAAQQIVNGKPMVNFTPAPGFTGDASFTYTLGSFTGATSAPATVGVVVEDLRVDRAVLRPKFMKWRIQGTSSDTVANEVTVRQGASNLRATLTGAQEVPPVQTSATGTATVSINNTLTGINFSLTHQGLINIQAAHIHLGAPGQIGPVIFDLATADFPSGLTGSVTAANLQPAPADGINTFDDAINAILAGNAYVAIHTAARPAGEIRGQLGPVQLIGTDQVGADGTWMVNGKLPLSPDESRTITVQSGNKVRLQQIPVNLR